MGYFCAVLMADYLSYKMLSTNTQDGDNLNAISHKTALELIKKVQNLGLNVKRVILDTVGDPNKYKYWL